MAKTLSARPSQVKRLRRSLSLTQAELAAVFSVSLKTIEAWEGGTRPCKGPAFRLVSLLERYPHIATDLGWIPR